MTSGLSGSPAAIASRSGTCQRSRSSWISIRPDSGRRAERANGAANHLVEEPLASKRAALKTITVASASHGAYTLLHACLAHPGEDTLRWTSPGRTPAQYIVDRCPTG